MNEIMRSPAPAPEMLLYRMKDLPRVVGLSRTQIYRRIAEGQFPKGVHLSPQVVVWKAEDVRKWVEQLVP